MGTAKAKAKEKLTTLNIHVERIKDEMLKISNLIFYQDNKS